MIRTHKIRLYPNNVQKTHFVRACGIKRFVYNWGLAERKRLYSNGDKVSGWDLKKQFNSIKKEKFPFVMEVSKCVAENALLDLEKAYQNFFRGLKKGKKNSFPVFKKKGVRDSFRLNNDQVKLDGDKIRIPRLGWVRMAESLRFIGKLLSVTISRTADRWFASVSIEIDQVTETQGTEICGIDLGINHLIVTSDGTFYENPNQWKQDLRKLQRLGKNLSRKVKGSNNRRKAKDRLAKYYLKLSNKRQDYIHKMTTEIAHKYHTVYMEDLNVKGMVKNRRLSRRVSLSMFGEIKRQLEYKTKVITIDRFYPSTQLCPVCNTKNKIPLSERVYRCGCGYGPIDRDLHAACNILRAGCPDVKPVEFVEDQCLRAGATDCEAGNVLKTYNGLEGGLCNFL